jgi:hypothetical protein
VCGWFVPLPTCGFPVGVPKGTVRAMRIRVLVLGVVAVVAFGACVFLPPRIVDEAKTGDAPMAFSPRDAGSLDSTRKVILRGSVASTADFDDYWALEGPSEPYSVRLSCTESAPNAQIIARLFSNEDNAFTDSLPCDGTSVVGGNFTGQFRVNVQFVGAGAGGSYEVTLELLPAI